MSYRVRHRVIVYRWYCWMSDRVRHRVIVYKWYCWMSYRRAFCLSREFETRCEGDIWGLQGCEVPSESLFWGTNKMQYSIIQNTLHMRRQLLHVSAPTEFRWTCETFAQYNRQDATFHNFFISARRCTCFRRFFLPSSGAQNCTYSVRPILLRAASLAGLAAGSSIGLTNTLPSATTCSYELSWFPSWLWW